MITCNRLQAKWKGRPAMDRSKRAPDYWARKPARGKAKAV